MSDAREPLSPQAPQQLEAALEEILRGCREALPELSRWESEFRKELINRLPKADGGKDDRRVGTKWLQQLHAPDLLLAFACLHRDSKALAILEASHLSGICTALARKAKRPELAGEIRQAVRERLLVPSADSAPRLASYSGGGPLGAWIHVVATRIWIDLRRAEEHLRENRDAAVAPLPGPGDAELAFLKARYGPALSEAFEATLTELPPRDRTLLRLHYVDGMSTTALGKMYGVHGTTAMRWISQARESILEKVRAILQRQLKLNEVELESMLGLVLSRLDLDLSRQLKTR